VSAMLRYRAELAYVGTHFHGWQRQRNADRTVQALLEDALGTFAGEPVTAVAAGRTDAGVHADGQVVHFDLSSPREPDRIRSAVNALLPWDAKLLHIEPAARTFHARRDAVWKEYLYRWSRAEVIPPGVALFAAPIAREADADRIAEAARDLPGSRDFAVFSVRHPRGEPTVRTLHAVAVEVAGDEIRVLLRGDGFLRGMVRAICGVLADVARGAAPVGRVAELLATGDRGLLRQKAPARGLTLRRVHYEREVIGDR
jgi:tRNA pseudouridine38-40 synthase